MVAVTGQSPSRDAPQNLSVLEAVLERITYANEDTGYTIARVATERTGPDLLTVVGPLLGAQVGESLRLTGRWSSHPRYGRQFEVHSYTTVLPATIQLRFSSPPADSSQWPGAVRPMCARGPSALDGGEQAGAS